MTRNRFIPKATISATNKNYKHIPHYSITKKKKLTKIDFRKQIKIERTIEEHKREHCKGLEERELQLGV
jgi:hypothetical protein